MKECPVCGRQCRDSYNLRRHMEGHASSARAKSNFSCQVCGRNCRDNSGLKRHMIVHVSKDLRCSGCRSIFATLEETEAHKLVCINIMSCYYCGKRTASKNSLRAHIKRFHDSSAPQVHLYDKQCPLCHEKFQSCGAIEDHFSQRHQILLDRLSLRFDNEQQFYEWKEQLETSTSSFYRVYWSYKMKGAKKVIFLCHRVGKAHLVNGERRKRSVKIQGSNKIDAYCPARLRVHFLSTGVVQVNCITTHVGHDFTLSRIPLTRQLRLEIAEKIAMNVSFDDILKAYQKEVEDGNMRREHLLTRKDLHNIKRDCSKRDLSLQPVHPSYDTTADEEQVKNITGVNCVPESTSEASHSCDRTEVVDEESEYICYVLSETENIIFHEIRKRPPVSELREQIRASVSEVLKAVEATQESETLERVCKAVSEIRTMLC